jgi:phage tail-like protein
MSDASISVDGPQGSTTPTLPDVSDSAPQPPAPSGNAPPDPVGELRFQVQIDDVVIGVFAECSGLQMEYDVFEYQEGGQLSFVHKLRGGVKYQNLVLKRGVTHEQALVTWFLDRSTDRDDRGNIIVNLIDDTGQQVRSWAFASAFPVKWSGPSLSAKSNNIATETLEICHQGLVPTS